jgi:hypothetical protein
LGNYEIESAFIHCSRCINPGAGPETRSTGPKTRQQAAIAKVERNSVIRKINVLEFVSLDGVMLNEEMVVPHRDPVSSAAIKK